MCQLNLTTYEFWRSDPLYRAACENRVYMEESSGNLTKINIGSMQNICKSTLFWKTVDAWRLYCVQLANCLAWEKKYSALALCVTHCNRQHCTDMRTIGLHLNIEQSGCISHAVIQKINKCETEKRQVPTSRRVSKAYL